MKKLAAALTAKVSVSKLFVRVNHGKNPPGSAVKEFTEVHVYYGDEAKVVPALATAKLGGKYTADAALKEFKKYPARFGFKGDPNDRYYQPSTYVEIMLGTDLVADLRVEGVVTPQQGLERFQANPGQFATGPAYEMAKAMKLAA